MLCFDFLKFFLNFYEIVFKNFFLGISSFIFSSYEDSIAAARKIKRKGAYLSQATGPSSYGSEPYKYEEIHSVEYANHQPYSEHYEYESAPQTTLSNTYLMDNGLRSIAKGTY